MGLKQSIVIRSEYTNNARSAPGGGSRGASPGAYVLRYMAREDATEILAPVKLDQAGYASDVFTRYMARASATEVLKLKQDDLLQDADAYGSPLVLKHRFKKMDKLSGRAFGSRGLSLSQKELIESSDAIQKAFDEGHSVQKIVVSFTEDYLRETGVLDPDFKHRGRGSYKGHIDQLKLRQAISNGVNRMTKTGQFEAPEWVGTIQLDTSHVHAHIALTDTVFSRARMCSDGSDRGKINEREKKMFRKGIHSSLEDMRDLKSFHKQVSLERQNVVAFVKDYAYTTIQENAAVQLLIAALPKDRRAWRYKTNRKSMKKANELATRIVEHTFKTQPEKSGYIEAMNAIRQYARESARVNKLSRVEYRKLIENGRGQLVERSVNGLYGAIKSLDPDLLHVRTPMTDIQSSSDEELAAALKAASGSQNSDQFDPAAFELRVRGYNARQDKHKKDARVFYDLSREFDAAQDNGLVDDTAHVMRVFYEEEQRYHMALTDKYRYFLSFHHDKDRDAIQKMRSFYEDLTERFHTIKRNEKETGLVLSDERNAYKQDLKDYTFSCFEKGVASLKEWDAIIDYNREKKTVNTRFVLPVRPKSRVENLTESHFNQVKAFDVHHLGLDYYDQNARIDAKNAFSFADQFVRRKEQAEAAKLYLDKTRQSLPVLDAALNDIQAMESAVDKAVKEGLIQTVTLDDLAPIEKRQLQTIRADYAVDVATEVRRSIEDLEDTKRAREVAERDAFEDVLE